MKERRKQARYHCKLRVGAVFSSGHSELLWADECSRRGLSVHSDKARRIGERAQVVVFLCDPRSGRLTQANTIVQVACCVLDASTQNFRIGLRVERFIGDAEALFSEEIERLAEHLQSDTQVTHTHQPHQSGRSFPLHRRIKLALNSGGVMTGWTENITLNSMRVALDQKLEKNSIHNLTMPILLAGEPEVLAVRAKARVNDLVFRAMGNFATHFLVFDYQNNGLELLRRELHERFPDVVRQPAELAAEGEQPEAEAEDAEVLPSLGDQPEAEEEDAEVLPSLGMLGSADDSRGDD